MYLEMKYSNYALSESPDVLIINQLRIFFYVSILADLYVHGTNRYKNCYNNMI